MAVDERMKERMETMTKKKTRLFALLLSILMLLAGCSRSGGNTTGNDEFLIDQVDVGGNLKFTTGGDQGTYYAFGSVLAGQVSSATGTTVTAITSQGSQANIQALAANDAQLAFVQSDVMAYAYNGTNLFSEPVTNFSTVCAMYMEQVQIVTLDPSIRSVADLAGRTVSVGDAGSGVYFNAIDILGAYGIDINTGINPVYESFGTSADSLQDGKIDAAFVVAGAPTNAITSLSASRQVYLVSLDDEHIDALLAASPYYARSVIPAETYNMPEDAVTVAVSAVVIARDDVPTIDVYHFVSAIYDNLDAVTAAHAKGAELDMAFAASITSVPYHQGAYDYFDSENGFDVPLKDGTDNQ